VGQYIVVKRDVFNRVGGYKDVRQKATEDVYLARHIKECGYKTLFLDIKGQARCQMYKGYRAAIEGIGKNIFDFLGQNSSLLLLIALAVLLFLFLPFPLLFIETARHGSHISQLLAVNTLYTITWVMVFIDRKISWGYALFWPLMFFNLLYMALWSWSRTISGKGFLWKGRVVT
jgi:chlorobactene glucosyltransferase